MKTHLLVCPRLIILLAVLSLLPLQLHAEEKINENEALATAQRLQLHLDELCSISFTFAQQTKGSMSSRSRQASGKAFFIKDENGAKMRWNYAVPERQVIISDGITVKMYFEKLNQMIVTPAKALQEDVTYSFFTGEGKIEENFLIKRDDSEPGTDDAKTEHPYQVIKLVPRAPTSQINSILLWVNADSQIQRIVIRDTFDTLTILTLSNIEENSLPQNEDEINLLFSFTPPKGTEIIQQ